MSNAKASVAQMETALKRLHQQWEQAKALWNDPVRWRFENEHWDPLERQAQATLQEMTRLAEVLAQARRSVK